MGRWKVRERRRGDEGCFQEPEQEGRVSSWLLLCLVVNVRSNLRWRTIMAPRVGPQGLALILTETPGTPTMPVPLARRKGRPRPPAAPGPETCPVPPYPTARQTRINTRLTFWVYISFRKYGPRQEDEAIHRREAHVRTRDGGNHRCDGTPVDARAMQPHEEPRPHEGWESSPWWVPLHATVGNQQPRIHSVTGKQYCGENRYGCLRQCVRHQGTQFSNSNLVKKGLRSTSTCTL